MTKDEALKMAIEFIHKTQFESGGNYYVNRDKTIKACKEALETPECNPHPKAPHGFCRNASHSAGRYVCECEGWQLEWQGLSDDEIIEKCAPIWGAIINTRDREETVDFARAIEKALKEKNG
jgi:hypothetical protein